MLSQKLIALSLVGAEWVLWLLVALSALALAVVVDRLVLFARTRERITELEPVLSSALTRGDLCSAREVVEQDSFVRNVLRAGLEQIARGSRDPGTVEQAMLGATARERARYEARLTPLGTIGNAAPFLGLFGTVLGIVQAFYQMGQFGATAAAGNKVIMTAIGEALVTTGLGIMVAIPAVAAFNWARSSIASRLKHAEALMRALLSGMTNITCVEAAVGAGDEVSGVPRAAKAAGAGDER
jgi:biopolymer transport protein ExbB